MKKLNEVIDYTSMLNEIIERMDSMKELMEYVKIMLITVVSLNIFDFIWKKIRQPKRLRGGINE